MTAPTDDDIKEVLLNFDIKIVSDIGHDLVCGICGKLMIEPHNMSCGCTACKTCFETSVKDGARYCNTHNTVISNKNVRSNTSAKRRIEKLLVKCPHLLCQTQTELPRMMEHIRLCPYLRQECGENRAPYNSLKGHTKDSHSSVMMICLNNLRNEMYAVKKKYEEQLKFQQREIERLGEEVSDMRRDYQREQHKHECIEQRFEEQKLDMESLHQDSRRMKGETDIMKLEMIEMKKMIENIRRDTEGRYNQLNGDLGEVKLERIERNKWSHMIGRHIQNLERTSSSLSVKLEKMDFGEYIWTINNLSDKKKDAENGIRKVLISNGFYSHRNGYKMCIRIYPNGFGAGLGTHLYLGFVIMKGEYDDILKWPFKHRVTLSLMKQSTGEKHTKMEYEYSTTKEELRYILDKATNEKSVGLGYSKFILLETLACDTEINNCDKICICCSVALQ